MSREAAHRTTATTEQEHDMTRRSVVSLEDQRVTFVELFFDLVFVFSVTQVVGLVHHHVDGVSVGQAILVFWLVWWAWTQFTWALNPADTTHPLVQLGTLAATGLAFFMAIAVPRAFAGHGLAFAVPYVLVRVTGLVLYGAVASADPRQHAAVRLFATLSIGGLVAVLVGGWIGGAAQYWLWGLTILLDLVAAAIGGQAEGWNLRPEHFGERHGLFVIIALGESLIVAAGGAVEGAWTAELKLVAALAVAVTCALWWSYFSRAKPRLDHALATATGVTQSKLGRDVGSVAHFPMLCGVIATAVAVGEAVSHPEAPLPPEFRIALGAGLLLFLGGMGAALGRATGRLPGPRLALAAVGGVAVALLPGVPPWVSFAIALGAVVGVCVIEEREPVA